MIIDWVEREMSCWGRNKKWEGIYFSPFQQTLIQYSPWQYWKLFISLFNVFSTVLNAIRCCLPWCGLIVDSNNRMWKTEVCKIYFLASNLNTTTLLFIFIQIKADIENALLLYVIIFIILNFVAILMVNRLYILRAVISSYSISNIEKLGSFLIQ